jgi:hypothetical protein
MGELQDLVLDAHGVTRWKSARTIEGYLSITGMLWARKADGIVGFSQRFRHHECHALADKANAIGHDHRTERYLAARNDPVRHDWADLAAERLVEAALTAVDEAN